MRVTARGWSRNMGTTEIADISVSDLKLKRDERKNLHWGSSALFCSSPQYGPFLGVEIHWSKEMKMTGSYRMELKLTRSDILHLFRTVFGDELKVSLIEEHGFTVSPDLTKAMLKTVKLTDLTLGELLDMNDKAAKNAVPAADLEKPSEPITGKPLLGGLRRL